ncbi:unnamed protein product [Closterium sp. NIES-53]
MSQCKSQNYSRVVSLYCLGFGDQVAGQFSGRASCFKMDTGESPNTLGEYGVRSLPTVKIFKAGREQKTLVGAVNDLTLHGALDDVI